MLHTAERSKASCPVHLSIISLFLFNHEYKFTDKVNIVMPESLGCITTLFVCIDFNIENQALHLNIKIIIVFNAITEALLQIHYHN